MSGRKPAQTDYLRWWESNSVWNAAMYGSFHSLRRINVCFCLREKGVTAEGYDAGAVWQNEMFFFVFFCQRSTAAPTAIWCHEHTNAEAGKPNDWTHQFRWQTQVIHTQVNTHRWARAHTHTHEPAAIRHCVTVSPRGNTEESFDRVSDNVQCLLLHSFSITRQYARSTLAAANSFSLADLDLRAGLPISFPPFSLASWNSLIDRSLWAKERVCVYVCVKRVHQWKRYRTNILFGTSAKEILFSALCYLAGNYITWFSHTLILKPCAEEENSCAHVSWSHDVSPLFSSWPSM